MLESEFREAVQGLPFARAEYFSSVSSTNDVISGWAKEGIRGLCIAYGDEQTKGRGRDGRSWFTPPGSALAFSLLMNIDSPVETNLLGLFAGLGALAVCEAVEALYSLKPTIKWPNDVLLEGKKVCGVLAEIQWCGEELQAIILGIGINVAAGSVPGIEDLAFPASCIEEVLGMKVDPGKLLQGILENLIAWKSRMNEAEFVESWEERLAYKGKQVRLVGSNIVEGRILGLARDGRLRLQLLSGEETQVTMGEIQIRP